MSLLPNTLTAAQQEIAERSKRVDRHFEAFSRAIKNEFEQFWSRSMAEIQDDLDELGASAYLLFDQMRKATDFINDQSAGYISEDLPYAVDFGATITISELPETNQL